MTDLNQVDIEQGKVDVEVFKKTDAALALLSEKYSKIPDVNTKDGYDFVKKGVKELTSYRTTLDAERQRIKKPYLDAGRIIDNEAKRITAKLVELEEPMKAAKKEVDDRKKRQEEERIARLREKVNAIYGMTAKARNQTSDEIAKLIEEVDAIDTRQDYYDLTREAIEAQQAVLQELSDLYGQQVRYEEAQAEQERLRKEQAEQRAQQEITDLINETKMIPANLVGASAQKIENKISRMENYSSPAGVFGDRQAEFEEARKTAIQQLNVMLKQQRMVEEAQAKVEPETVETPAPAEKATVPEAPKVTEHQGNTEKQPWSGTVTESDREDIKAGDKVSIDDVSPEPNPVNDTPDVWAELAEWCDKWELSLQASHELNDILSRYL